MFSCCGLVLCLLSCNCSLNVSAGTQLIIKVDASQLSVLLVPGAELKHNTAGLYGTYDDNTNNEFTLPDGSVLPATSSSHTIYTSFGDKCMYSMYYYYYITQCCFMMYDEVNYSLSKTFLLHFSAEVLKKTFTFKYVRYKSLIVLCELLINEQYPYRIALCVNITSNV
jgi:hypothetical protein